MTRPVVRQVAGESKLLAPESLLHAKARRFWASNVSAAL